MLDRGSNDAVALGLAGPGRALDREVDGLRPTAGEDQGTGLSADGCGQPLVGLIERGACTPAGARVGSNTDG